MRSPCAGAVFRAAIGIALPPIALEKAIEAEYLEMSQDYVFSSSSTAASVVLGRCANGRVEWKDEAGRTLRQVQESEA